MKRIGYFAGIFVFMFVLTIPNIPQKLFASSDDKKETSPDNEKKASEYKKAFVQCVLCRKEVGRNRAIKVEHEGKTFHFCGEHCAKKFKEDPGSCRRDEEHGDQ